MVWYLTPDLESYESAVRSFSWELPDGYNIARDLLRKHEDRDRPALYLTDGDGRRETYTFRDLDRLSNRLANHLTAIGVERGDRVAVAGTQQVATPVTHFACWKIGAVSVALSVQFGEEAVRYRLADSGATVAVADERVAETVADAATRCPDLETVVQVGGDSGDRPRFEDCLADAAPRFDIVPTDATTTAVVLYTSGSTGKPKGVVHTHGVWVGSCPSFCMYYDLDVRGETVYWTPADWAWMGALGNAVFPAWHYGRPVVGSSSDTFDAERAFELIEEHGVTNAFLPPTALRMLSDVEEPTARYDLALSVVASGSEAVTPEILEWVARALPDVRLNELYGQTEANVFVADCGAWFEKRPGTLGRPVPGHEIAIIDADTADRKPAGEVGHIAIRYEDDPMVYEEYWNDPAATEQARVGGWHLTGDLGVRDEAGYVSFKSRADDLIITSGYRVGPAEIESVLLEHPVVAEVGVVGVPDETRGEVVKAFVRPTAEIEDETAVKSALQNRVRERYANYAYPRQIEFVDSLPKTRTGKVKRHELRDRE